MGQAKARGSKDQRVAEAKIAAEARNAAERKALAETAAAAQVARENENAERLTRGENPIPKRTARSRGLTASMLVAAAGLAMAYR